MIHRRERQASTVLPDMAAVEEVLAAEEREDDEPRVVLGRFINHHTANFRALIYPICDERGDLRYVPIIERESALEAGRWHEDTELQCRRTSKEAAAHADAFLKNIETAGKEPIYVL